MNKASSVKYDNRAYWQGLHRRLGPALRTVGRSSLSEALNRLKYESEHKSLTSILDRLDASLWRGREINVLDVGAGTGYWTSAIQGWLARRGGSGRFTAVDISREALDVIVAANPTVRPLEIDLRVVPPDALKGSYDLVIAMYSLHHLPMLNGYLNAFRFAARSVRPTGYFLLMDPIPAGRYSPLYTLDVRTWRGNGTPRSLSLVIEVAMEEGLTVETVDPAVSFLINGPVDAGGRLSYAVLAGAWRFLSVLYRSEGATRTLSVPLRAIDGVLKRCNLAYSSSLLVLRRA
jgi:SAM-dependent methyltransferase